VNRWIRKHPRSVYWIAAWATVILLLQIATLIRVLSV
jgi:hypothetical protein